MPYLTAASDIRALIAEYAKAKTLWVDTEVADHRTRKPRLSLIQVLADPRDMSGDRTSVLDVLEQPQLVTEFIDTIMTNPTIEKVFHNASYDIKFLGKNKVKNSTCTLEMAKKIPYYMLPLPNRKLKTLVLALGKFSHVDKAEQASDWGQRPITAQQLQYAQMDCVYVAHVHQRLLELIEQSSPDPATEELTSLIDQYQAIEPDWRLLDSKITHLHERIKKAMQAQNVAQTSHFKLSGVERSTIKVAFTELAKLAQTQGIDLDFPVTLTQTLQKELGTALNQLPLQEEKSTSWRLISNALEDDVE